MRGIDLINLVLPDELIVQIFEYIGSKSSRDACSLVCMRWLALERLSRNSIGIGSSGSAHEIVKLLGRRFPNIRSLHIDERITINYSNERGRSAGAASSVRLNLLLEKSGSGDIENEVCFLSDGGLSAIGDSFNKLEKVSLARCSHATSVGLKSMLEKYIYLKSLDLQGCDVGDQGLVAVGECCKKLEDLNLRFCEDLIDTGLVKLAIGCGSTLKTLSVVACAKITDVSLEAVGSNCRSVESISLDSEFIHNKGVLAVAKGCLNLKALKLHCINVADEALEAVGQFCLSLELLSLYGYQRFTNKSLRAIGNGCKKLRDLTLTDCYFVTDKGLEAVAVGCTELRHLELNGCPNIGTSGLETIGRSCTRLSELALLHCKRIYDYALCEVGRGCKYIQAFHLVDCSNIGNDAICSIARGCKHLKKLHIRRCYEVGNRGIIAVGENCKFLIDLSLRDCDRNKEKLITKLRDLFIIVGHANPALPAWSVERPMEYVYLALQMYLNTRVGDAALVAVSRGCCLHHLNVSGCHQIGDTGIIAIARGCPQLRCLDISDLQNLGNMAMLELGEGCPLLKVVVLSRCREISDVGLGHLVKKCEFLECCHMVYCPGITAAGVATLVSSCGKMKKIVVETWKVTQRTRRRAGSINISHL